MIDLKKIEKNSTDLMNEAMKAGADACDVVVAYGQSQNVSVRDGVVENTGSAEGNDFSLRVFLGKKVASVSTNQISDLKMLAERAVSMAKVSPEDPFQGLADPDHIAKNFPKLELDDETELSSKTLTEMALKTEEGGLAVEGVDKSMGASAGTGRIGFVLAASNGFIGSYTRSGSSMSAAMVSGTGEEMERDFDYSSKVFVEDLESPGNIGRKAGERAVAKKGPRQIESGSYPIIFDRRAAGQLLGAFLSAINGNSIVRKTSFLRDEMHKYVMNKAITIHDDPKINRGLGSRLFDGEGLTCYPMILVEDGQLNHWLLDGASARELGETTNGRASRSGSGTSPSSTNSWIEAGDQSLFDMFKQIGNGLYVTETIGHGVNMVTGDFSKGASGYWIENGEKAYPVAEITTAGNLKDMFLNMIPASDLIFKGATNSPSLLIEGMTVGGK